MRIMLSMMVIALLCMADIAECASIMTFLSPKGSLVLGTVQDVKVIQKNHWMATIAVEECLAGEPVEDVVQVNVLWGLGGVKVEPPADIADKRVLLVLEPGRGGFWVPSMSVPVFPEELAFAVVSKDQDDAWVEGVRKLSAIARKGGADDRDRELERFLDDPKHPARQRAFALDQLVRGVKLQDDDDKKEAIKIVEGIRSSEKQPIFLRLAADYQLIKLEPASEERGKERVAFLERLADQATEGDKRMVDHSILGAKKALARIEERRKSP